VATQPKTLLRRSGVPFTHASQIAKLAERGALAIAQTWFNRERVWINEQHLELCRVAAPTFFEQERAEWFRERLSAFGWDATLDRAGNVRAVFGGAENSRKLVVSAHLDTVLAPARAEDIYYTADGRLTGPGVSDNGAGLAALLALARVLTESPDLDDLRSSLLLVANVGEEGEGNLSGMRYLCQHGLPAGRTKAFLVLDGPSIDHVTAQALASRRFEISFSGPGGHSWNDSGVPNPIHAVSQVISTFLEAADERLSAARKARCSYHFGIIEGGASVNAIPSSARAKLDVRSEDAGLLDDIASLLTPAVERSLQHFNRNGNGERLAAKIKELGSRPSGRLPEHSGLLQTIEAVDSYLHIRARVDCASTDANVPLSLGLPAISIGAGGQGGGAHTPQEWYLSDRREIGLRRILLVLAALANPEFDGL
jgi:acetylornithine deacetylase/succinyl-diaminopimelate desuccinylase-like protein